MPPISTLQSLTQYAAELLALCEDALTPTVGGVILRSYLSPGTPAFDCEQLTVDVQSLGDADMTTLSTLGAGGRHITGALNLIGFRVTVVRDCVPTLEEDGDFPDPIDMQAKAVEVQEDVWAIWTRVRTAKMEGTLFDGRCNKLFFDGARALETAGGTAGWEIDFRANIPGFVNSGS